MARGGTELRMLLGDAAFVALADAFGGTRLYVPSAMPPSHPIAALIGQDAASKLVRRYAPDYLVVPMAKDLRALHYRERGCSNAEIARRLGMTESNVERTFSRLRRATPAKPSNQLPLFPDA